MSDLDLNHPYVSRAIWYALIGIVGVWIIWKRTWVYLITGGLVVGAWYTWPASKEVLISFGLLYVPVIVIFALLVLLGFLIPEHLVKEHANELLEMKP